MKALIVSLRLWLLTALTFGAGFLVYSLITGNMPWWSVFVAILAALTGSFPAFCLVFLALFLTRKQAISVTRKKINLFFLAAFLCALYGLAAGMILESGEPILLPWLLYTVALLACFLCALLLSSTPLNSFFTINNPHFIQNKIMETSSLPEAQPGTTGNPSNKILWKSVITGVLILAMLIPAAFISNLVRERKNRQAEVVTDVSERWAQSQLLTGPYLYLPYKVYFTDKDKKENFSLEHLIILPEVLEVDGKVSHEIRKRSIYKVLLYRAALSNSGYFKCNLPKEIEPQTIQWQEAKICYNLSDFKGIEEKMVIQFNGIDIELSPGLPSGEFGQKGLSASVPLTPGLTGEPIKFSINLKIKGSEQLHFQPLAGNSRFTLQSDWGSPSFDGSDLPATREVSDSGFTATWNFNKANLPFGTVLKDFKLDPESISFGVTLVQPADGYAKTDRSIKYAILFIGLTFSLFFIIELRQKRPVHPVQYILIGLALIIFYTLLLSLSEFITFDLSYFTAAAATILLISFYAYGHFKKIKTAALFGSMLAVLYGFTFVLIRLEDTALLLGSIGLFIILAFAMYFSRKIDWYGQESLPSSEMQEMVS